MPPLSVMRLDQEIAQRFELSRRKARELLSAGRVLVNQRRVSIASREVTADDHITLVESHPEIEVIAMRDEWLAVNKPAGMPTQPTRDRKHLSLEEALRVKHKKIWLVHRLDTPTSGVVVFARSSESAARLSELFVTREVKKIYLARVDPPMTEAMTIDRPIEGKDALTIVQPREGDLVEVEIRTGRMHQIRRHLSTIGHPVVGDQRYGSTVNAPRLMLHAFRLEHPHIGLLEAPVPADFH